MDLWPDPAGQFLCKLVYVTVERGKGEAREKEKQHMNGNVKVRESEHVCNSVRGNSQEWPGGRERM